MPHFFRGIFLFLDSYAGIMGDMNEMYDENYWKDPCPSVNCKKAGPCCGLKYAHIPAVLEDATPATRGAYSNAIVEYEGSGAVYIYSAEGIPVLVKEGDGS